MTCKVGIIGLGFVGSAIYSSFQKLNINVYRFDKYKNGGIGTIEDVIRSDIILLCLPTPYDSIIHEYDKSAIYSTCDNLIQLGYNGIIIIKSTIEIGTIAYLESKYPLNYIHNPEFLTARTADEDFHNQTHIVLGKGDIITQEKYDQVIDFYKMYYPNAKISECLRQHFHHLNKFVVEHNQYYFASAFYFYH